MESHDKALVGDKTLIFRLADKEMYWHMDRSSQSLVVDRAVALHKMARLATISMGAQGYLNFMGNEFGHPEWIDCAREGNAWSFAHCRRQWSLADNPFLRYGDLNRFDAALIHLMDQGQVLLQDPARQIWLDEARKILVYRRNRLLFAFNFHPTESYTDFPLPLHETGTWHVVLDTDEERFGGLARIAHEVAHDTLPLSEHHGDTGIRVYLPSRTALVLQRA